MEDLRNDAPVNGNSPMKYHNDLKMFYENLSGAQNQVQEFK